MLINASYKQLEAGFSICVCVVSSFHKGSFGVVKSLLSYFVALQAYSLALRLQSEA